MAEGDKAAVPAKVSVPPLTVVPPVYLLLPDKVSAPEPDTTSDSVRLLPLQIEPP